MLRGFSIGDRSAATGRTKPSIARDRPGRGWSRMEKADASAGPGQARVGRKMWFETVVVSRPTERAARERVSRMRSDPILAWYQHPEPAGTAYFARHLRDPGAVTEI